MKDLIIGKRAKFSLLAALLACALTAGLAMGAAEDTPAPAVDAVETAAPPAAPPRMARPDFGAFAQKHHKFLEDTKELRRQIAMKEAALKALKRAPQPDVNLIQQFAGELFDLREQMRAKAAENGLPPMMGGKMGAPCRGGFMGRSGYGEGGGHHAPMMGGMRHGRHGHHASGGHHGGDCGCGR